MDLERFYSALREPDFIPGYEIGHRLGGGTFGEVYKARKLSIGKPYAIKFLRLQDDAQRAVVERELAAVRLFAAIDHPNLVSIEDAGEVCGVPYILMGYAGEQTLARQLRQGRVEPAFALSCWLQACRGVQALHERRLMHLDVKPSNIFLNGELARVGDSGLARLQGAATSTLSFGRGTPHYMAPEILANRADRRADIYSLGVVLYELFSGELPYMPVQGIGYVLRIDDRPPPFPRAFPPHLRALVEGCLRLDPADRYGSLEELLAELGESPLPTPRGDARRPARVPHHAQAALIHAGTRAASASARGTRTQEDCQ